MMSKTLPSQETCRALTEKEIPLSFSHGGGTNVINLAVPKLGHFNIHADLTFSPNQDGGVTVTARTRLEEEGKTSNASVCLEVKPRIENPPLYSGKVEGDISNLDVTVIMDPFKVQEWQGRSEDNQLWFDIICKIVVQDTCKCAFAQEKKTLEEWFIEESSKLAGAEKEQDLITFFSMDGREVQISQGALETSSSVFKNLFQAGPSTSVCTSVNPRFVGERSLNLIGMYFECNPSFLVELRQADYKIIKELVMFANEYKMKELFQLATFQIPGLLRLDNAYEVLSFLAFFNNTPDSVNEEVREFILRVDPQILHKLAADEPEFGGEGRAMKFSSHRLQA